MKRIILCLLAVLPVLMYLPTSAQAVELTDVQTQIIEACTYGESVDISEHKLSEKGLEDLYFQLRYSGKLPWYAMDSYSYTYDETTHLVFELEPDYLSETDYDREMYEQRVAEVLDACVFEGMEDWQIALSIHDYLITNCVYDESLQLRTGYDLLVEGSTVCSGYTDLYQDLLLRVGIPCLRVDSEPMEHTWNLVQIGGQWYHADLTWDDPSPDRYGYVSHQYFLVDDETIRSGEKPHYDWVTDITCSDTRFDDAFFRNVESAVIYESSNTCYLLRTEDWNNILYRRDESAGTETELYTDKITYINIGQGEYTYQHYGLSLWNDRLYFCSLSRLHSVKTDGSDLQTVHRYDNWGNKKYLFSCHMTRDTAYLTLADHDGNTTPYTVDLEDSGSHTHQYVQNIQVPTCQEPGYTESVCECGLTAKSSPTKPTGHDYQVTEKIAATLFAEGSLTETCGGCGDVRSETLEQLTFLGMLEQLPENILRPAVAILIAVIVLIVRARKKKT